MIKIHNLNCLNYLLQYDNSVLFGIRIQNENGRYCFGAYTYRICREEYTSSNTK